MDADGGVSYANPCWLGIADLTAEQARGDGWWDAIYPDDRERINKDFQSFYDRLLILRREREGGMEPMLMAMATGYDYRKYQRVKAVEKRSGR